LLKQNDFQVALIQFDKLIDITSDDTLF